MEAVYCRAFDIHPIENLVDPTPYRGFTKQGGGRKNAIDLWQLDP
jgi:hypothetical protein